MAVEIEELLKHLPVALFLGIWIVGLLLRFLKRAGRASAPGSAPPPQQQPPPSMRLPGRPPQSLETPPTKFADERGYKPIEPRSPHLEPIHRICGKACGNQPRARAESGLGEAARAF